MELMRSRGGRSEPAHARTPARTYHCEIRGGDLAPGTARRAFDAVVDGDLDARSHDAGRLMVSELVTNSVLHADVGSEQIVELDISCSDSTVRVTVGDDGPGFEASAANLPSDPRRAGGRGLFLVDRLADRWGVHHNGGTRVWFEIVY